MERFSKLRDLTGRAHTGKWDIGGTDLGAMVTMPNGELLCVFGDTFSEDRVGGPNWRSPVGLIGNLDGNGVLQWVRAAGPNPNTAEKFWPYAQGGEAFSTVLPSDVVVVGDTIYLHVMVNKGLGNVVWTEVWQSKDNARTWTHLYKIDAWEDNHGAELWTWDYAPDEGYVYAYTTRFNRAEGLRMRRIKADRMHDKNSWEKWGYSNNAWRWGGISSVILPGKFGEVCLRRIEQGVWVLTGFDAGNYRIDVRVIPHPTADLIRTTPLTAIAGAAWGNEPHESGRVAQLYGGYVLPGSKLGVRDGFGLIVSQWNTDNNLVYKSMQFAGTVPVPEWAGPVTPPVEQPPVEESEEVRTVLQVQSLLGKLLDLLRRR